MHVITVAPYASPRSASGSAAARTTTNVTDARWCGDLNLPHKTYNVIVADPPWQYRNKKTGGSMISGSGAKYPTMSLEDICLLNIPSICQKDCVLFLWGTTPLADYSMKVMDAWGFKYKTNVTRDGVLVPWSGRGVSCGYSRERKGVPMPEAKLHSIKSKEPFTEAGRVL
jgi:hypothetical protein